MNDKQYCEGEKALYDSLCKAADISLEGYDIVIWGAGNTTELNRKAIMEEKLLPCFFVDGDSKKWGTKKWDIDIVSPDNIKKRCANPIVLISSANPEACRGITAKLNEMEIVNYHMIDEIIWGRHREEIMFVYNMLESENSKKLFARIILSRMAGEDIPEEYVIGRQYFIEKNFRMRNSKQIFVDCGAYVGDSIEQYLFVKEGVFGDIYAFEPDSKNVEALSKRVQRLKDEWGISEDRIHIIEGAVGKENGRLFIQNDIGGLGAKVTDDDSGNEIQVYGLDSFFKDAPVGFIKADIEGYEFDMLEGAAELIKKYKPLIAICVYHQSTDLYKIPLFLKELNNDYRIKIAQHYYDYTETVLYAY